tara:strand:- start:1546 stop:3384 length:1839 start_codon:yes stop_codon:yes gene_type:complete
MAQELTEADEKIRACLREKRSFVVIAGAGSGKTTSLIGALNFVRTEFGRLLRRDAQKVACITYTKRACAVITERLGFDSLFEVSTIHRFLWGQIGRYTDDIRLVIAETLIPSKVEKYRERDNGGQSQRAKEARNRIAELEYALTNLEKVKKFNYDDSQFSDFPKGQIGHDDMIEISAQLILTMPLLRRLIGQQFPYLFIDEAQDTFAKVVDAFNAVCDTDGLPIVGYFGDPMQQIYETGVGDFAGPQGFLQIDKKENFRSATSIITLANALRNDIQQKPGNENAKNIGNVGLTLIAAEEPLGPRKRYTDVQLDRALERFDRAVDQINWRDHKGAKRLYLARQMIARRLGFLELHRLFTGAYASSQAQDDFEGGSHFLLNPFIDTLCPLMRAVKEKDDKRLLDVLRDTSPTFDVKGPNHNRSLKEMLGLAIEIVNELTVIWHSGTIRQVLEFSRAKKICAFSERLERHLERDARGEVYDSEKHSVEKSDWLADEFFTNGTDGLLVYSDFIADNTAYSTQHGVKGEEYDDVLVVFDDVEAGWNQYSFTKLLIPGIAGEGTDGQMERTRKLAYVCFTRARQNLQIILFCPSPNAARDELVKQGLFTQEQVTIFES